MQEEKNLVREVDMVFISRRIRILGIAIMLGIAIVFALGIFISSYNVNENLQILNHITLGVCIVLCSSSYYARRELLKKVTKNNFSSAYFNAHIIAFALCDFGGLICIVTSLFVNQNIPYAAAGFVFSIVFLILNFPGLEDYKQLNI